MIYGQEMNYQRSWGTYFGDDSIRITDSDVDYYGNLYLVGFINHYHFAAGDSNFTTTSSSYQPIYGGGISDGIIVKIDADGNVLWSTYFGGEKADAVTAVKIDKNNDILIMGGTSSTQNIATSGAYQTSTIGTSSFLAKFSNDGFPIWSTYYDNYIGVNEVISYDNLYYNNAYFDVDSANNIYFSIRCSNEGMATSGAYQPEKNQSTAGNLISKFTTTGQRIWATYYGINKSLI